ncbi:hypothetical protein P3S67_018566 [Capsicum chacoense]
MIDLRQMRLAQVVEHLHHQPSGGWSYWIRLCQNNVYGQFLKANTEQPGTWKRASFMEEVLREADVISSHPVFDKTTYHLVNKERPAMMKEAILVDCSRWPVIDEVSLVELLRENPMFRVGLDVFEWTREGMTALAALNALVRNIELGCEKDESTPLVVEFQNFREWC